MGWERPRHRAALAVDYTERVRHAPWEAVIRSAQARRTGYGSVFTSLR